MTDKTRLTTNEVMDIVDEHLQEANKDTPERLRRIDELIDFLQFNRRLTELTDEEKQDFVNCEEGYPLTDEQRKILDENPMKREYYINTWARGTYFRLCAWRCYLFGETSDKPSMPGNAKEARSIGGKL